MSRSLLPQERTAREPGKAFGGGCCSPFGAHDQRTEVQCVQQRKLLQVQKSEISERKLVRASCIFVHGKGNENNI